jgi:hypothetical protein
MARPYVPACVPVTVWEECALYSLLSLWFYVRLSACLVDWSYSTGEIMTGMDVVYAVPRIDLHGGDVVLEIGCERKYYHCHHSSVSKNFYRIEYHADHSNVYAAICGKGNVSVTLALFKK